ncbi:MAG: UDP-N-acetylmuramoyl-L-alanine--D-glutamate ligase [Desulfobacterales bacterium]|nr:MAG: UDP-N-acetylmuramoyl-L-alanine--D-glutamate ligase [Desulfobacterales bacterium]
MNLAGKKILVVGLGKTGVAAARFLTKAQASVVGTDTADENELGSQVQMIKELGIKTELGQHQTDTFEGVDLIMISPGVSHTIDPIVRAQNRGIPVIGEVELASRFIREPIVAVTGTNGKTTTTELIGAMLKNSGRNVFVGGNIGSPLIGYVEKNEPAEIVVAEISSFQLDTIESFRPKVSVLLNISADHLDRYPDFDAYAKAKMRIFENQQEDDIAVLNGADARVCSMTRNIKCKKLIYPNPQENENGAILKNGRIILKIKDKMTFNSKIQNPKSTRLSLSQAKIQNGPSVVLSTAGFWGRHNRENACAATLAALVAGASVEGIQKALNEFQRSTHRLEYIDTINHVKYFNDSKATNVEAVIRALECFSSPVILIMGGRDKGSNFNALNDAVRKHAKILFVMGEAGNSITSALGKIITTKTASSMKDAVLKAFQAAAPGDVVLLSPGCASFDMYDNYAQRGDDFRKAVNKLK